VTLPIESVPLGSVIIIGEQHHTLVDHTAVTVKLSSGCWLPNGTQVEVVTLEMRNSEYV
jgi:hypothetical protein